MAAPAHQTILIVDFGSQFTQLIARRVRELNVYCEIVSFNKPIPQAPHIIGVILSGSPASVTATGAPYFDIAQTTLPILGVCYGAQLIAHTGGGRVAPSNTREYGRANLKLAQPSALLAGVTEGAQVWMSHSDTIQALPTEYEVVATTGSIPIAAYQHSSKPVFGLQFHPEVSHTTPGLQIIQNFVVGVCGARQDWTPQNFADETVANLHSQLGTAQVVCALSGGVDSTVAAVLLDKAIGKNLHCIFVNNGLLRQGEYEQVLATYRDHLHLQVTGVDASQRFMGELAAVADPEQKRKIIGRLFIEVFEQEAKRLQGITHLAQGTIYPDVIESVSVNGPSVTIKSHHNVGGLPERMQLQIVEPLRFLFKDEVRRVGLSLGIPAQLIGRHPFPGPGLAIRVIGAVSEERLAVLRQADAIFIAALREYDLYDKTWQAFAVLLPVSSVGVMGDERTYENVLALRAVTSIDGMTADWAPLPHDFLAEVSSRIINAVKGVNRVVYDISSKPPATIEWE